MGILHNLWTVAAEVLFLNLPFGFWRAGVRKFSLPWILAVHAPVPFVIALRYLSGLGWRIETFPVMVGAFFAGQFLGGKLRGWRMNRSRVEMRETGPGSPQRNLRLH